MLTSITPLGERGRGNRWALTASAYMVGSVAGGCVLGLATGALGLAVRAAYRPPSPALWAVVAGVCLLAAAFESRPAWRFPSTRHQVNEDWLGAYRGWVYGSAFGFQLGLGLVTIMTSSTVLAMAALGLVAGWSGSLVGGVIVGGCFGLARSLPMAGFAGVTDFTSLQRRHATLRAWQPRARAVSVSVLAAVCLVALAAAALTAARG